MGTDIDDDAQRPTAVWFRMARASQKMPDGRPWTVNELVDRMQTEIGWAPSRPNYSTYERGHTVPKPETMAKFYAFWGRYGIEPPDLNPAPMGSAGSDETSTPTDLASAIRLLTDELAAIRLEREAWRRGVVEVLRSYEAGQVPTGLLDALAPRLPEDAPPAQPDRSMARP